MNYDFNQSKKEYREYFAQRGFEHYIFHQPFWLDAIVGADNWNVILFKQDVEIVAYFVFCFTKEGKKIRIINPQLTQFIGLHINYTSEQKFKRYSLEKKVISYFIDVLEKERIIDLKMNLSIDIKNWQPFYWRNFSETTKYSFRLCDISDIKKIEEGFAQAKRKNIKKAEKEEIQVRFDISAKEFYDNHKLTLAKQGEKISYTFETFDKLYNAAYKNGCGRTIYAVDKNNNLTAALFVIWTPICAFDLISTIDPDYRNNGSATLLVYEMIKHLSGKVKAFDFEGSMIENVANSFAQFGADMKPYYCISKVYDKQALFLTKCKGLIKRTLNHRV